MTDDAPKSICEAREQEEQRRVDDDYLSELQRVWAAATKNGYGYDDCFALPEESAAAARAPEDIATLLAEVKRLRECEHELAALKQRIIAAYRVPSFDHRADEIERLALEFGELTNEDFEKSR